MSDAPQFTDNESIVLGADGVWRANGEEITHEATCRMLFRNLKHDNEGYYVQAGRETKRVQIEDTAYFITRIDGDPDMGYELWLSDGTKESLDPGTLQYKPGRLTCRVTTLLGEMDARFLRLPYFELLKNLKEDEDSYYLNFAGSKVTLSRKERPA